MNPHVRLLVSWSVGFMVCHHFLDFHDPIGALVTSWSRLRKPGSVFINSSASTIIIITRMKMIIIMITKIIIIITIINND